MANKKNNGNQSGQQPAPVRLPDPPPGMMRVTRTELVWPGKYNEEIGKSTRLNSSHT